MKTLKKTLCLILAVVMVVGVLILPANAASIKDYKDNEDIKYKEAVEVLSGLGILGGKDTGYFAPKGTLNRAEAAKIIAWMLLGEDAEKLHSNTQIFADVAADNWAAGYIAFCKNEGILAGDGTGNFRPNGELNGVDFGKMLLTALGYDAKLEGYVLNKDWDKNIIAQMLNKNSYIDIGTVLSNPMTREEAAQMAFLALQQSTVKYPTTIHGTSQAVPDSTTLGGQVFGLDKITGVVTANEYADLDDDSPAGNGKSVIGGETYNYASDLTDIGLYYEGWACGQSGTKTIIHLDAVGNTVYENAGVATTLKNNFFRATGLDENKYTVYFTNFGDEGSENTANIRIRYEMDANLTKADMDADAWKEYSAILADDKADDLTNKGVISNVIKEDKQLSAFDMKVIKFIFDYADLIEADTASNADEYVLGEVYVGTQSAEDVSDTMSYKKFVSTYITTDADNGGEFDSVAQGNWLKVIDNDNDGVAEYVFQTTFTMTTVDKVAKNGTLTLVGLTDPIPAYDYATSADLAVGDVVIWTYIDGTFYVEPAPSFTGKVDKYTYKTDVLTVEGEDYPQSEITAYSMADSDYILDVEMAKKNIEYTYYQDFFGNIRAFEEPVAAANSLVLLTDGWYRSTKTGGEYAVRAYLDDEIGVYDVNSRAVGGFVTSVDNNNSWGNLKAFDEYNKDLDDDDRYSTSKTITNLARYSQDEDGVLSLANVKTYAYKPNGDVKTILTDYVQLDASVALSAGQRTYGGVYAPASKATTPGKFDDTGYVADIGDDIRVQTNNDTVFYYVWPVSGGVSVLAVTGYKNTYAVAAGEINAAYAVARNTNADSTGDPYWVAEAVVIETENAVVGAATNVVFGYNVLNKTVSDFGDLEAVLNDTSLTELEVVRYNNRTSVDYNTDVRGVLEAPAFYLSSDVEGEVSVNKITSNFAKYGIYTATVDRAKLLRDYVVTTDGTTLSYDSDSTIVYRLKENSKHTANLIDTTDSDGNDLALEVKESYILVADSRGNIIYAILKDNAGVIDDLYDEIVKDTLPAADELTLTSLTFKGQTVKLDQKTKTGTVSIPYAIWNDTSTVVLDVKGTGYTVTPGAADAKFYKADETSEITPSNSTKTALTPADDYGTIYAVVSNGANSVKYKITVTLEPASAAAELLTLNIKGLDVYPVSRAGLSGKGTEDAPYIIPVAKIDGGHNDAGTTQQLTVTVSAGATWSAEAGTAGISAQSNADADSQKGALTAGSDKNFTITVTAQDTKTKTYYKVEIATVEEAWKAAFDLSSGLTGAAIVGHENNEIFDRTQPMTLTVKAEEGYYLLKSHVTDIKVGGSSIKSNCTISETGDYKTLTIQIPAAQLANCDDSNKLTFTITAVKNPVVKFVGTDGFVNGVSEKADGAGVAVDYAGEAGATATIMVPTGTILTQNKGTLSAPKNSSVSGFIEYTLSGITEDVTLTKSAG